MGGQLFLQSGADTVTDFGRGSIGERHDEDFVQRERRLFRKQTIEAAFDERTRLAGTRPGDDPLAIPRIEIRGSDPPRRFLRKLWLGGD